MANYTLTPSPWQTFFYANGAPVAGGQLFTYLAGTTTPAPTYLNASGTPNTNPIILDAAGRAVIYLAGGSYRFDLYDSVANGGALIKTEDNITSVPLSASQPADSGVAGATILAGQAVYLSDGSGGLTAGRWYLAQANNAYSSTNPEVGFAAADTSAGNAIAIIRIGQVVSGLTVTTGLAYYIDPTTAGAVTATAPPYARYLGQADTASSLVVGNAPPPRPLVPTPAPVGVVNNFQPFGSTNTGNQSWGYNSVIYVSVNNATLAQITGIVAGYVGQRLILSSGGAGQVDLLHQNAGSSVGNRLQNLATSAPTSLAPGVGVAEYVYDTLGYWRLVHHEQGKPIVAAFNAANFTGMAPLTWTVTAPAVNVWYVLRGRLLTVSIIISGTTTGGAPGLQLNVLSGAYGGHVAASLAAQASASAFDGSTFFSALAQVAAGGPSIALLKLTQTAWALSASTLYYGGLTFEVQ